MSVACFWCGKAPTDENPIRITSIHGSEYGFSECERCLRGKNAIITKATGKHDEQ